jgi:hypothetical protein
VTLQVASSPDPPVTSARKAASMAGPLTRRQTVARSLHDLGAAAWFGGALMGAVGLHGASGAVSSSRDRVTVADAGWQAWRPWKSAALAAHVAGSLALVWGNKGRLTAQRGAMSTNLVKVGVFGAALAADVYAANLGKRIGERQPVEVDSAVEPTEGTDDEVAALQQRLQLVQWAVPALTGANIVLAARMGEQQRPTSMVTGVLDRLPSRG